MATQQVAPIHRASVCIGENEIIRFPILRSLPGCVQNRPQDSVGIERDAPATGIGVGIVEFAFVETFHDFDSIRLKSLPTQSRALSEPTTIRVTIDLVGSGNASITRRMSCFASNTGGFRAFLRGRRTSWGGFTRMIPQVLP